MRPQRHPKDDGSERELCVLKVPARCNLIIGRSVGWWSKTFSHGDGAIVNPAARLVCIALGSWRLVSRNDKTSHESEVRMRHSAEELLGRFAPHFLLYCASLVAKLEALCVANPDQDIEVVLADSGDASVLVHGGRVTWRCLPHLLNQRCKNRAKPIHCFCATLSPTTWIKVMFSIVLLSNRGTHCGNGFLGGSLS